MNTTNERPTPETDAYFAVELQPGMMPNRREFAENLERQRDALRDELSAVLEISEAWAEWISDVSQDMDSEESSKAEFRRKCQRLAQARETLSAIEPKP